MPERLGDSRFDRGVEESPDQTLLGEARFAASEILRNNPEDLLSREIAEKINMKAEVKDRVDEMFSHADDVTVYQEFKKLGVFIVRDAEAGFDYDDSETGFSLRYGDRYLDLHVPPVPEELRSRDAVLASLNLIEQYVDEQGLNPKYLMGITYERMARLAERRFGFRVAYPAADSLPDAVVVGVERVYEGFTQAGMDGREIGLPAIVFKELSGEMRVAENAQTLGSIALAGYPE